MRVMGIDYGDRRIGIALSDETGVLASGVETIRWDGVDTSRPLARIHELVLTRGVGEIVIGLPRRTDGKFGASEAKAEMFAVALASATGLPVQRKDERYTTVIAARMMREAGHPSKERNARIDQIAATVILQEELDARRRQREEI